MVRYQFVCSLSVRFDADVEMLNDGRTLSPSKHEPTLWTTASFYGKTDIAILVLFPYLNPYKEEALSKGDGTSHVGSSSKSADKIESSALYDDSRKDIEGLEACVVEVKLNTRTTRIFGYQSMK